MQADCMFELASVLGLAGDGTQARRVIGQAIVLYAAKGNRVAAAAAQAWSDHLDRR
jgi:hypothetical protein